MTPFDLLARGWAGQGMTCRDTNLPVIDEADWDARVVWHEGNTLPKPTLAEVEARRAELEAAAETERKQALWREELTAREDKLLQALEVLAAAIDDLQAKARTTSALSGPAKNQIDILKTRLAQIRAMA